MTDEDKLLLKTAIHACNEAISALCAIEGLLKQIPTKSKTGEASSGSNVLTQTTIPVDSQSFKPVTKTPDVKGNPLSELLHNLSEADKAKLTTALQQKVGNDNAKT